MVDDKITKEMREHFESRTKAHIKLVQEAARELAKWHPDIGAKLVAQANDHDRCKFKDPEAKPYVFISWQYKCKDDGVDFSPPGDIDEMMKQATYHHVKNNKHHAEFWDDDAQINERNRDAIPDRPTDASKMDIVSLAEMVCDWYAMGIEKGNTAKSWADKMVGTRWKFTDDQVEKIYEFIDDLEGGTTKASAWVRSIMRRGKQ